MKQKLLFSAVLTVIFAATSLTTCLSSGNAADGSSESAAGQKNSGNTARRSSEPAYTGDGGKGVVIAVPAPVMRNSTAADKWIPQLFQDLITGDLARYSAMTVLDRANESLTVAEQKLSETGFYSDSDFIEMGNMTNAQYIVAGNIQNVSGRYNVTFRVNHIETNEIKASFNKAYSLNDIEKGLAAKETVRELLAGMGVELTESGEKALLAIQPVDVRATAQLARGAVAAKSDNIVESLAFFSDALNSNTTRNEANKHIQSFFVEIPTGSIRERANYAQAQAARWNKIFVDLEIYIQKNLAICVYDFSVVEDKINIGSKTVDLNISPGIKVVPNRTVLLVYKTIIDNWIETSRNEENRDWVSSVKRPQNYGIDYDYYSFAIGLYDDYNDRVAQTDFGRPGWSNGTPPSIRISYFKSGEDSFHAKPDFQVLAQQKYYDESRFRSVRFSNIPLDKITDTMTPKIDRAFQEKRGVSFSYPTIYLPEVDIPVMTVAEWREWVSQQGQAR